MMLTMDVAPNPEQMRRVLTFIIQNSTNEEDVEWAEDELERITDTTEWAKPA